MDSSPTTPQDITRRVFATVEEFFALPAGRVGATTTASDIEGWDSVNHVGLILAVEEALGVTFDIEKVGEFADIGELAAECRRLLAAPPG